MSEEQPKAVTFFFDGTHGKMIPESLRAVGLQIKVHRNLAWLDDMLDVDWIAECGKNNWAIISGDKSIERVPEERQAVINAKCKVFMFEDSHETRTEDWAASLLVGRHRLVEIAEKANGPFVVTLKRCKVQGHLSSPRFVAAAGGGWKPVEEKKADVPSQAQPSLQKPAKRQRQGSIEFPPVPPTAQAAEAIDPDDDIMIDLENRKNQKKQ